jgi:hypothetical protein
MSANSARPATRPKRSDAFDAFSSPAMPGVMPEPAMCC